MRFFEDSGTVNPASAYYVHLENVTNSKKQDIKTMIDLGRYFSIFAPRQSGKTTFLEELAERLHTHSTYAVVILSFQDYSDLKKKEFYSSIETELYDQLINRLKEIKCEKTEVVQQFLKHHHLKKVLKSNLLVRLIQSFHYKHDRK